jgi:hypothetical protein
MSTVPAMLSDSVTRTATEHVWAKPVHDQSTFRACSSWLIAPGHSLKIPRLDQVPIHHCSFGSDAAAARFGSVLLEIGIAKPSDWNRSTKEPARFLQRTLDRFVRDHGEKEIDGTFELSVTLSTDPHEWCETDDEPDGSQMFLYFEAHSCGFVNLGPALALCEESHPNLPTTFARMFLNSLGSCFRIYDDRDAEEHISLLEENYDPTEDAGALSPLPDRSSILPPCMKVRPLGPMKLESLLSGLAANDPAARLLNATLELRRAANRVHLPPVPEAIRELFCDCNPPVPVLLAIYQSGDAIEACFDDERQSMLELTPEPWPLIAFNGTDPESTLRAFRCLGGALDVLAAARRVFDLVPGWEPISQDERRS